MRPRRQGKVILRSVREYDVERIRTVVREGLEALDLRPRGRTLVKPNSGRVWACCSRSRIAIAAR